ncbi:MAG: TIM barrel protein, partial [Pseudoxanthomonas sp.]
MKTLKGPALFLAQFIGDKAPFDRLDTLAKWASDLGYVGIQVPTSAPRLFDLAQAAQSQAYCDDIAGMLAQHGIQITELSTHLQGQLVAVHPAYDTLVEGFAPQDMRGNPAARQAWAVEQVKLAAKASQRLGLTAHATFSGALAWPYFYPWPQRPNGLVDEAFAELGRRWRPILEVFDEHGVDLCYEIHP